MSKNGSNEEEPRVNPVNEALDNLTTIFQVSAYTFLTPETHLAGQFVSRSIESISLLYAQVKAAPSFGHLFI